MSLASLKCDMFAVVIAVLNDKLYCVITALKCILQSTLSQDIGIYTSFDRLLESIQAVKWDAITQVW